MKFKIRFLLAVVFMSTFLEIESLEDNSKERLDRKFKKKIIPLPIPFTLPDLPELPDLSNKPQLPSLDSLFNFTKPSIPTPTLPPEVLEIKDQLATGLTDLINLKNRFPNFVAQLGNFKLLQVCLLFAFGGLMVGIIIFLAEAWTFKKEEKDNDFDYAQLNHDVLSAAQGPQYGVPQYGAPAPSYGYGSSQRRRQYKTASAPYSPAKYPDSYGSSDSNLYSSLRTQETAKSDPLFNYNYASGASVGQLYGASTSLGSSIQDMVSNFFQFPSFNMNKKKKIMFG